MKLKCLNANCEHQCIIETTNTEMPNTCPWCDAGLELFEIVDEEQEANIAVLGIMPHWAQPRRIIYDTTKKQYYTIENIVGKRVRLKDESGYDSDSCSVDEILNNCVEARVRKYTDDEMYKVLGKEVFDRKYTVSIVSSYRDEYNTGNDAVVLVANKWTSAKELAKEFIYNNGDGPCGVLEHIENGEWVE